MVARIEVAISDAAAVAGLRRLVELGHDLTPVMDEIGAALLTSTQQRFEAEAGPGGTPWPRLAKRTLQRRGAAARALRESGRLYASLTYEAAADQVALGTNIAYAGVHQFGATIEHFARSQQATFRQARDGAGIKPGPVGPDGTRGPATRVGSRLRFAKKRAAGKGLIRKPITIGAHSVTIPARPYLGFDAGDAATVTEIIAARLAAIDGGAS